MANISLKASVRTKSGHKAEDLRKAGILPAVTYGHGLKPAVIEVDLKAFLKVYEKAGTSTVIQLELDTEKKNVVIHDVQYHPVKGFPIHADFYQVRSDEKIKAEVPLRFTGVSIAVKDLGGILVKATDKLEVEAFPQDLPPEIIVDLSVLKTFEEKISLKDLKIPAGVKILVENQGMSIASVNPPRSEEEIKALDEAVTEDVEAIEGVKPKAEGEDVTEGDKEGKGAKEGAEVKAEGKSEPKGGDNSKAKPEVKKVAKK